MSKAKFWQMIGRGTRLCRDFWMVRISRNSIFLIFVGISSFPDAEGKRDSSPAAFAECDF